MAKISDRNSPARAFKPTIIRDMAENDAKTTQTLHNVLSNLQSPLGVERPVPMMIALPHESKINIEGEQVVKFETHRLESGIRGIAADDTAVGDPEKKALQLLA